MTINNDEKQWRTLGLTKSSTVLFMIDVLFSYGVNRKERILMWSQMCPHKSSPARRPTELKVKSLKATSLLSYARVTIATVRDKLSCGKSIRAHAETALSCVDAFIPLLSHA